MINNIRLNIPAIPHTIKYIKYLAPLHGKARSDYLNELTAVICPSLYVEPFCGVNVEAQLYVVHLL